MQNTTLLVEALKNLTIREDEKDTLLELVNAIQKEQAISNFKTNRLEKDRIIAVNLLESSVEDLNKQNLEIKAKNTLLEQQTQEIEAKNKILQQQQQQLKATTEQLRKNLHSLEISYEELENFSFIASHDLKTPLRSITSFAQLLDKKYNHILDDDARNYLNFIVQGVNKMNNTVNDLIDFAKLSNKNAKFIDTDLNEVIKNVLSNLEQRIAETKAVILTPKLPVLHVYKSGMTHLFENLLDNALKFSKQNEIPVIEIKAENVDDFWQFSVHDNGLGLDESYQKKAFQPFQRISNLERPGTGMGLAICKKVVQIHGGNIWYQSKIGEGSIFNFTIEQKRLN
jgi:light-regulated signal transduction histidine kinase (bacteriophytochrome)